MAVRPLALTLATVPLALQFVGGRIAPALLMGYVAWLKLSHAQRTLAEGTAGASSAELASHYAMVAYSGLAGLFLVLVASLFLVRKGAVRKLPRRAPQIVALAAAYILTALPFQPVTLDAWWVALLASLVLAVGMACTVASLLVLGRCFGILPEARGLVTSGPYRYIRHPLYTFESLAFLGMLLPVLSPLSVATYAAYLGLTVVRAGHEEEVLTAAFPEYANYRRSTWRFIPGLY